MMSQFKYVQNSSLLDFCCQSAGITCQQAFSTNPESNVDTDSYGFVVGI